MSSIFRAIWRRFIRLLPGGLWFLSWTEPHATSHKTIRAALEARAGVLYGTVLDIGCGMKPYRDLFTEVHRYVGIDMPAEGSAATFAIDVYGDATRLPIRDSSADGILCSEVLEHLPEPAAFMCEAARVLRPGGHLLLTTPQTWGLHEEPRDFFRYTKYGLMHITTAAGLKVIEVEPTTGLWGTFTQRVVDTVAFDYAGGINELGMRVLSIVLAPLLILGHALDRVIGLRGDTLDNVLVARKLGKDEPG